MMNSEALQRVTRARSQLVLNHPFFGVLALHLKIVERPDVETMATDGEHLFYAPGAVLAWSEPELLFVMAHEVFHCALGHMGRIGPRDLRKANEAADYAINPELVRMRVGKMPAVLLYDPQWADMGMEEIYAARAQAQRKQDAQQQAQGQAGQGAQGAPAAAQGAANGNPTPGKASAAETYGIGGIMRPGDGSEAAAQAMAEKWQVWTRQAVAVAAKQAGEMPGMFKRILDEISSPDASAILDRLTDFIDSRVALDYSFMRPNRRFLHAGVILPGAVVDGLEHLIFAVDTSGSIDSHMLNVAAEKVIGALESGKVERLTVVFADTHVRHVQEFALGDDVAGQLDARGGGGTRFDKTFEWIEANAPDATAVIYLTDMECNHFGRDPGMPVLWAIHGDSRNFDRLAARAPFGEAVYIGRLE